MSIIALFFKLFLALLIIRVFYLILRVLYAEFAKFYEFIIVGSGHYWKRKWRLAHRGTKKIEYKNIDIYNPGRGWALIPNLSNKDFNGTVVNSDSDGARGMGRILDNRDIVLFFGDSFCFGEDVNDDKTIPYFFGERLKSIQAINLGVHGYGIDQQYLYLKEAGIKYQPKMICFIIYYEDFIRNFLSFRDYAKPNFVLDSGNIKLTNYPVPPPEYYLKAPKISLFFLMVLDFFRLIFVFYGLLERANREKLCAHLLDQINLISQELHASLFFVYIPNNLSRPYRNYIDKFFSNFFNERKLSFLNLGSIFTRSELSMMIDRPGGHFSAKANEMIADKLVDLVKENRR